MLNQLKIRLFTHFLGQKAGTDNFGNTYFQHKNPNVLKRWVVYNGICDPSKIPANWHVWLHSNNKPAPTENLNKWKPNTTLTSANFKGSKSIATIEPNSSITHLKWLPKNNT